jgi:hypothetical protein
MRETEHAAASMIRRRLAALCSSPPMLGCATRRGNLGVSTAAAKEGAFGMTSIVSAGMPPDLLLPLAQKGLGPPVGVRTGRGDHTVDR